MLSSIVTNYLPAFEKWNKPIISTRDSIPLLYPGDTFTSTMIIDPPPTAADGDITISCGSDINMIPNIFKFTVNGPTSIPFIIKVKKEQQQKQMPLYWNGRGIDRYEVTVGEFDNDKVVEDDEVAEERRFIRFAKQEIDENQKRYTTKNFY
jgi:hypothetical protein